MKKNFALIIFFSLLVSCSGARQGSDEGQKVLIFTHATIINTASGDHQPDMTVVIMGGCITNIKKSGKGRSPEGAQVVDATGKFLIPGLWDMHIHGSDERYYPLYIVNGVTGVRNMWGNPDLLKQRKEISKGNLIGPRLIIASPIIDGPNPVWPGSISVSNKAEALQTVRYVKEMGYDFVKGYELLSREAYFAIAYESKKQGMPFVNHIPVFITAVDASNAGQASIEHLAFLTDGILVACSRNQEELQRERENAFGGLSIQKPSTDSQLKARRNLNKLILQNYDQQKANELISLFVKNNTWQCPTLTVARSVRFLDDKNFLNDPRIKYMPKSIIRSWSPNNNPLLASNTPEDWAVGKEVFQKELEIVGAMRRAGVKFIAGTDVINPFCFPGFSLHDELSLLVQAGLTPMEALQTATYNAAEFLGQLDSLGTVETGKIADLVLLDANPLEDINNTRKISAVVVGGKYYPRTSLDEMLVRIETLAGQNSIAETLFQTINEKDLQSAITQYHELKKNQFDYYDFRESELNTLGYHLLDMNKILEAIEIFKLNVEAYPQSFNVYDSLGEAYMVNGDREQAIMNYEKSLELNPQNSNAVEMLKKLGKE